MDLVRPKQQKIATVMNQVYLLRLPTNSTAWTLRKRSQVKLIPQLPPFKTKASYSTMKTVLKLDMTYKVNRMHHSFHLSYCLKFYLWAPCSLRRLWLEKTTKMQVEMTLMKIYMA